MEIVTDTFTDNYFWLLRNLNNRTKLELISKLTNSLLEPDMTRQEQMLSCFGSFISEESADELINEIWKLRHFRKKEIEL